MKTLPKWIRLREISLVLCLCLAASTARAGTVSGTVRNGTDGNKPASGVDVRLIQLMGGMQIVASTKTDAQGVYHFDNPGIGQGPMLIRAIYRGVFFHQPLTPGTATVDVTIYEPTTSVKAIQVPLRLLVFQPNGDKLMVGEEYSVQNVSNPPAAYYKPDGNFEFTIPPGADLDQVSTFGPSGMPIRQGTIDKGKGKYAISYAFQPGQNGVRISYTLPYANKAAAIKESSTYDAQRMLLVIPPTMQISSPGFSSAGTEQGFNVFSKDSVKTGAGIDISLSGTAPPPSDQSASSGGAEGAPADNANGHQDEPGPTIETAPARIGGEKWILLGGLGAIFAVGVALLWRKPIPVEPVEPPVAQKPAPKGKKGQRPAPPPPSKPAHAPPPRAVEQAREAVNADLDSLKDTLLRIELRRQAGTISEADYALERGRAEQLLRDLVQG
ncbi:MAG: hypothetical protein ACRD4Y_10815 [Candidatus Acidiferrales bacterium]